LPAVVVHRQPDHEAADLLRVRQAAEVVRVALRVAARVGGQRRGDPAVRVADGQPDADAAGIDAQQPGAGAPSYLPRPFSFSSFTSFLMPASSRRSATRVALPSWMMSRSRTPTVATRWPASAATTQPCVSMPQWAASTVLPWASCGCIRSNASQLPTSSQRYGA